MWFQYPLSWGSSGAYADRSQGHGRQNGSG